MIKVNYLKPFHVFSGSYIPPEKIKRNMFSNNDRSEELCPGYIRRARSIHTVRFIKFIKSSMVDIYYFFLVKQ